MIFMLNYKHYNNYWALCQLAPVLWGVDHATFFVL